VTILQNLNNSTNFVFLIGKIAESASSVVVPEFESPTRGKARATAHANQLKAHEEWKKGSSREGTMPIPVGNVVTVHVDKVDRGHTDPKRYVYLIFTLLLHVCHLCITIGVS
jgi:hypothetical protein